MDALSHGSVGAPVSLMQWTLSQCRDRRTAHGFFDSKLDLASEVLAVMVAE